jgi:thymidylate synthase (FAD)
MDQANDTTDRPKNNTPNYVPDYSNLIGKQFDVLDNGYIRVVDLRGDDSVVVMAARQSTGGTCKSLAEDRKLIRYMLREGHTSPFEMCEVVLELKMPIFVARQWMRHRTASINEFSQRYAEVEMEFFAVSDEGWREQSRFNRQCSGTPLRLSDGRVLSDNQQWLHMVAEKAYQGRLEKGVSRELARVDLPLSTYTTCWWRMDVNNLLKFLSKRMRSDAQKECRLYAEIIGREILAPWMPLTWEAFVDYDLESERLSRQELECLRMMMRGMIASECDEFKQMTEREHEHFRKVIAG